MSIANCEQFKKMFVIIKETISVLCATLYYCERHISASMSVVKKLYKNLFYYQFWPVAREIFKRKCIPTHIEGFDELTSQEIVQNFNTTYYRKDHKLTRSLLSVYWERFFVTIMLRILLTGLYYSYPQYFYPYFINFAKNDETHFQGFLMVLQLTAASLGITYCVNKNFEIQNIISMEIKTIVMHLINSKILRDICDRENKIKFNNSLITTDLQAITSFLTDLNYIWVFALTLSVTLYYLYNIKEFFAIIALISLICALCLFEYLISKLVARYDKRHKAIRSKRLDISKEMIYGIKVIKLYGLNKENELKSLRSQELRQLKKLQVVETLLYIVQTVAPIILYPLLMLISFVISSQPLTIEKIFVTLGYLEVMNYPTKMCSKLWICRTKLKNSWERIEQFLDDPSPEYIAPTKPVSKSDIAIQLDNVEFKCGPHQYSNINFLVPKGSKNVIIGDIGAGKSTFLAALLKLVNIDGTINVNDTVSYVPAEPFLFQDTLEENIVFGQKNSKLYETIIEKVCLTHDLSELPRGDKTEINERGVNLSGGQKQRICLARSMYQNAGIYLLDDPLTSVDMKVTKEILNNLLNSENGLLKDKTVLYAANNLSSLKNFAIDNAITVANNRVVITPFKEFQKLDLYLELTRQFTGSNRQVKKQSIEITERKKRTESTNGVRIVCETDELLTKTPTKSEPKHLLQIIKLYRSFATQFGQFWIFTVITLAVLGVACSIESYRLISELGNSPNKYETILKYGMLKLAEISIMIVNWMIIFYCCLNVSNRLFDKGVTALFKLPIQYFHKMSSGGVSYLFSSDFAATDTALAKAYRFLVQIMFTMISSIASIWYLSRWNYWTAVGIGASFILIVLYLALIWYNMQISFLLKTSERSRKLMISKYFADADSGAVIIKTNGMAYNFKKRLYKKLDDYLKQALMTQHGLRWFTCHLEFVGVLIVFTTMSVLVMLDSSSAAFGIALICTGKIIYNLNQLNMSITSVNDNMVSFDKIDEFVNLSHEQDGPKELDAKEPINITFNNVTFSYDDRPVLNKIYFELNSSDRLGIVGRTGSGKSTIISSLLRLIEVDSGEIEICGENIKNLKLQELRNLITLIPQECDIFAGSIAQNLDPSNLYINKDASVVDEMLERLSLKDKIMTLPNKLDTKITYDSKEISDGEKQLLCLVRGLLRNTKIMVFDETCSKVDLKTERLIQDVLNSDKYCDTIMMVVAHRLQSLEICNKIMVLDNGQIIEYGLKEDLMQNTDSYFYKLIKEFDSISINEIS